MVDKLIDEYFEIQKAIYNSFGYFENYRVIPIEDRRDHEWALSQQENGKGSVYFHPELSQLDPRGGQWYKDEIYTQVFLSEWVYRNETHIMICVDTNTDGNKFLAIYRADKEVKDLNFIQNLESY